MGDNSYNMATVPTQIVNLPKLQYLYMHNCDLSGTLDFVPNFAVMQEFWIDKNAGIIGSIPSEIGQLSNSLGMSYVHILYIDVIVQCWLIHFSLFALYSDIFGHRLFSFGQFALGNGTLDECPQDLGQWQ